jgi:GNAT superfamily N-acetyltransferase
VSEGHSLAVRASAHLREQAIRRAAEVVEGPAGLIGVFDAEWPVSHLSNRVLVTADLAPEVTGADVLGFTDSAFAGRGLTHRKIDVLEDGLGRRLGPDLVLAGYDAEPVLLMVAGRVPPTAPADVLVEVVDEAEIRGLVAKGWRTEAADFTDETVRQLVDRRDALDRAGTVTRLAVRDPASGEPVARADLLVIDAVAEVDDVLTLPDHRGRGYASALVIEAVARALAGGADLVYLEAAEDDWPKELYARLGFTTVGSMHEHTRLGVDPES